MEATLNFEGYVKQLNDAELEALLFSTCAEELRRAEKVREQRQSVEMSASTPRR